SPSATRTTCRSGWPLTTSPGRSSSARGSVKPMPATAGAMKERSAGMASLAAGRGEAGEQLPRGGGHLVRRQPRHAAVVERADALLARAALDLLLEVHRLRGIGFGPGDVRRAKQRHHRPVEGGGEVPG